MQPLTAYVVRQEEHILVSLDDYPDIKLGFALDKLSMDGKFFSFPIDTDPSRPWTWKYEEAFWPAIEKLLLVGEMKINDAYS